MDTLPSTDAQVTRRRPQAHVLADYSGRGAATVADDLRRLGLRPGVQRVDAATPEEIGAILAQDPPAGASVARNSVITLYVGAATHDTTINGAGEGEPAEAAAAAPGVRRRRKSRHARVLDTDRATPGMPAGSESEPVAAWSEPADDRGVDGHLADRGPASGGHAAGGRQDGVAPVGQRVHQDDARTAHSTPTDDEAVGAPDTPDFEARAMLTPLEGLPRGFTLKRWRRVPRRARAAMLSGLVCVLALLAITLAGHSHPPAHTAATAQAAVSHPTVRNRAPRTPEPRRPGTHAGSHAPVGHRSPDTPGDRRPRLRRVAASPAPAAAPVPPSAAPPSGPVSAPAPQPATPVAPASTPPLAVGGQIPGGPFSP